MYYNHANMQMCPTRAESGTETGTESGTHLGSTLPNDLEAKDTAAIVPPIVPTTRWPPAGHDSDVTCGMKPEGLETRDDTKPEIDR